MSAALADDQPGHDSEARRSHKPLWPFVWSDYATLAVLGVTLFIAAGGGIGGGGVVVPIYVMITGFDVKRAAPLGNVTILGGAIANTLYALAGRHPLTDRPLQDWSLVVVMVLCTLIGAPFGGMAHRLVPPIVITCVVGAVLGAAGLRIMYAGVARFVKEGGFQALFTLKDKHAAESDTTQSHAKEGGGAEDSSYAHYPPPMDLCCQSSSMISELSAATPPPTQNPTPQHYSHGAVPHVYVYPPPRTQLRKGIIESAVMKAVVVTRPFRKGRFRGASAVVKGERGEMKDEVGFSEGVKEEGDWEAYAEDNDDLAIIDDAIIADESMDEHRVPLWKPALLTITLLGIIVLDLSRRGSQHKHVGMRCGSVYPWVLTFSTVGWGAVLFIYARKKILLEQWTRQECDFPVVEGDIEWTPGGVNKVALLCVGAGLATGLLGMGDAVIQGPLMLSLGVLPQVTAASAATMVLYTSAALSATDYAFGRIQADYSIVCFVWGFVCTAAGQHAVTHMVKRYKKESLIVLSMGLIVLFSAVLTTWQILHLAWGDPRILFRPISGCALSSR